jgi:hypothetical protein
MNAAIAEWLTVCNRCAATLLVLGVTPELCKLQVNAHSQVIAVDNSIDMIRWTWLGRLRPRDDVICANWCRWPPPPSTSRSRTAH